MKKPSFQKLFLQNHIKLIIKLNNNILKWPELPSNRFLLNKQNIFEGQRRSLLFSRRTWIVFLQFWKIYHSWKKWTYRNLKFNQWTNKKRSVQYRNLVDVSPIYCFLFLPYVCTHCMGNGYDDISSEENKNKNSRGSNLGV
jgi:hypothetical protein